MGRLLHLTAVWLGVISIVLASPADTSPTPAVDPASIVALQLVVPLEPTLKTSNGTVTKVVTGDDKPTIEQSFFHNVTNFKIKTRPWDAIPTSADEKTLLRIHNEESVLKKRREEQSAHAPVSNQISRIKRGPLVKRADKIRLMIVGDSISQGMEGDWTWRYRLWEWLGSQPTGAVDFEFVGPWTGTRQPPVPAPPKAPVATPPPAPSLVKQDDPLPLSDDGPMVSGGYAEDADSGFQSAHFALWGRQAAQTKEEIKKMVTDYQPTHLLVLLGFNDLGWFVTGPDGTLASIKSIVDNARAANPNIKIVLGDVVQRKALGGRADLPQITDEYNALLRAAIPKWNTGASPVAMAYVRDSYSCETQACPSGHDGLHPNAMGEYQIAWAFSVALFYGFGIGRNTLSIPVSAKVGRKNDVPSSVEAFASPYGIAVRWDKVYGARKYGVRSRYKGLTDWEESSTQSTRIDNTWVIKGSHYEYQIRVDNESDGQSDWSAIVDAIADPETIRGPSTIHTLPTETGADVSWSPVEGALFYVAMLFDSETPGSWLNSAMVDGLSYRWESQNVGRRHVVAVQAWNNIGGGLPAVGKSVIPGIASDVSTPASPAVFSKDPTTVFVQFCGDCTQTSYKLYQRTHNATFTGEWKGSDFGPSNGITNVDGITVAFLIPGVWNYEFAVSGLNGDLESPMSDGVLAVHPPDSVGSEKCTGIVCIGTPPPSQPVPETYPGAIPDKPVLGGPDRDLSGQICAMTWQTAGDPTPESGAIIAKTWSDSRAGEYLHTFLTDPITNPHGDWLVPFFKQTIGACSKDPDNPSGGTGVDCKYLASSSCVFDADSDCSDYCPPEAMFIHASVSHFFHAYEKYYQGIINVGLTAVQKNIGPISDTFAPVDTSVELLFSILGGILGTMSSVGWLVGTGYGGANAVGASIGVISGLISNTQLNGDDGDDVPAELSTILLGTLQGVFGKLNQTIAEVLNPQPGEENYPLIESVFKNGAFLDSTIVSHSVSKMIEAFNTTMNQYLVISAMKAWGSRPNTYKKYATLMDGQYEGDEEKCIGEGNEALIWYKNRCVGFGIRVSLDNNQPDWIVTKFLGDDIITAMKEYIPDLRLAIINAYECYTDPNNNSHQTVFPPFDITSTDRFPICFFNFEVAPITLGV